MKKDFKKLIEKKKKEMKKKPSKTSIKKDTDKYISTKEAVKKIYNVIMENSHIPPKFKNASFASFNYDACPRENVKKIKAIKTYAENILSAMDVSQSVYIYSKFNGCGKTHVAISALKTAAKEFAKEIYKKNPDYYSRRGISLSDHNWRPVFFMSEVNYLWKKRQYNSKDENLERELDTIENAVMNSKLLVIDDFLRERDTDFVFGNLTAWLNHRYDYNKPVIFTSNNEFKMLARNDESNPYYKTKHLKAATYLASRISEMTKGYQFVFASSPEKDYRQNSY
jgi:DNA replication protein DnaC